MPDYYDIIKVPMDWATMAAKLDRHEYPSALDFAVSWLAFRFCCPTRAFG